MTVNKSSPVTRLLMVDNQVSYSDAFATALALTPDLIVASHTTDPAECHKLCKLVRPDILLTDYRLLHGQTGTQLAEKLRSTGFDNPIVILTGFAAPQVWREAAAVGAHVLSKDETMAAIAHRLRAIKDGAQPTIDLTDEPGATPLSDIALEVLELMNTGMAPAEIAAELQLSIQTVRSRIKALHRELGVQSQTQAVASATRRGLLVPPN